MLRFLLLLVFALAGATSVQSETIDVKYYGRLDLAPFAFTDIARSSFINRACYDKAKRFMVVQLKTVYYPYCEMPSATYDAFLSASSMGKFYNANIKGTSSDARLTVALIPLQNIDLLQPASGGSPTLDT